MPRFERFPLALKLPSVKEHDYLFAITMKHVPIPPQKGYFILLTKAPEHCPGHSQTGPI